MFSFVAFFLRILLVLKLGIIATAGSAWATELGLWNRFDCFYEKQNGHWVKDSSVHSMNNFQLENGTKIFSPTSWRTLPDADGLVYGICGKMIGTENPGSVILEMYAWSATSIEEIHECRVEGTEVKLTGSYRKLAKRGDTLELDVPWSGFSSERKILTRIPTEQEMTNIEASMDAFCVDQKSAF